MAPKYARPMSSLHMQCISTLFALPCYCMINWMIDVTLLASFFSFSGKLIFLAESNVLSYWGSLLCIYDLAQFIWIFFCREGTISKVRVLADSYSNFEAKTGCSYCCPISRVALSASWKMSEDVQDVLAVSSPGVRRYRRRYSGYWDTGSGSCWIEKKLIQMPAREPWWCLRK